MRVKSLLTFPSYFDFRPSGRGRTLQPGEEAEVSNTEENIAYVTRQVSVGHLQALTAPQDFDDIPDLPVSVTEDSVLASNVTLVLCDASEGAISLTLPDINARSKNLALQVVKTDNSFNPVNLVAHSGQTTSITRVGIPDSGIRLIPVGSKWVPAN